MRLLLPALLAAATLAAAPVPIVFDTDMGNDIDDAVALAILHALESRKEAKILAVTITKDNPQAAVFVDLVNAFYGRPEIPIGVVRNGKTPERSAMLYVPVEKKRADGSPLYPRRLAGGDAPEATDLLRRMLAGEKDGSVVFVQVGFSTNLARLLEADPQFVARKARLLSVMAGAFPSGKPEYNVKVDVPAARKVFTEWPTPIVFSGWEVGASMMFPGAAVEKEFAWEPNHPVADSYRAYRKMPYDRPTWDPTSALYAVRPDRGYFSLSAPGRVTVEDDGRTVFTPDASGRHRYLTTNEIQRARTLEAMIALASQPR